MYTYRQGHRPLLAARRGAERRVDGDRGRRIAAGAAQTELEIQLAVVPGCTSPQT